MVITFLKRNLNKVVKVNEIKSKAVLGPLFSFTATPYRNDWAAEGLPAGVYYYYRLRVPAPGWDFKGWVEVVK